MDPLSEARSAREKKDSKGGSSRSSLKSVDSSRCALAPPLWIPGTSDSISDLASSNADSVCDWDKDGDGELRAEPEGEGATRMSLNDGPDFEEV